MLAFFRRKVTIETTMLDALLVAAVLVVGTVRSLIMVAEFVTR